MDILDEYEKYIENKIAKLNDMQNKTREETYMVDLLPVILEYMKEIRNRIEK